MKRRRGSLSGDGAADNHRARRYVAKYTICPAVAHGLDADALGVAFAADPQMPGRLFRSLAAELASNPFLRGLG